MTLNDFYSFEGHILRAVSILFHFNYFCRATARNQKMLHRIRTPRGFVFVPHESFWTQAAATGMPVDVPVWINCFYFRESDTKYRGSPTGAISYRREFRYSAPL